MSTAVTIGNFDGVHLGHASLIRLARQRVGLSGRVVVMSFDPHPLEVLRPGSCPPRLSTFDQRRRWALEHGADEVHGLETTPELLAQSPEQFVAGLVERFRPDLIVEGDDFRFGRARSGDVDTLRALAARMGFEVEVAEPVDAVLNDHTMVRASSSAARWLLGHARVADVARVLGRAYEMTGTVVQGDQRGRRIGYPTANLDSPCMAPRDGVYAGLVELDDGGVLPAAISVGTKPQFHDQRGGAAMVPVVEAHLLDNDTRAQRSRSRIPAIGAYGWSIRVRFLAFLRDQARFSGLASLLDQMSRDCARTRRVVAEHAACVPHTTHAGAGA